MAVLLWRFPWPSNTGPGARHPAVPTGTPTVAQPTPGPNQVGLEGSLGVANVTNGDTQYAAGVFPRDGDVIKVQAYYNNTAMDDSLKPASNVTVQLQLSGEAPIFKIQMRAQGDNTPLVQSAVEIDVPTGSGLTYLPGTAVWRHNTSTSTTSPRETDTTISDEVMAEGFSVGSVRPTYNDSGTITVMFRVESASRSPSDSQ